jgi:hypothetical protein
MVFVICISQIVLSLFVQQINAFLLVPSILDTPNEWTCGDVALGGQRIKASIVLRSWNEGDALSAIVDGEWVGIIESLPIRDRVHRLRCVFLLGEVNTFS